MLHIDTSETSGYNMAKRKNDNRQIVQSREWISNSLLKLMEEKPYHQITIKDIARHADLDRRTFYRHYSSKEGLLDEYILSLLLPHFEELREIKISDDYEMSLRHFTFLMEHISFLRLLKEQDLFGFLLVHYQKYICFFRELQGLLPVERKEDKFRLAFKTGGFVNIILQWLEDDPVMMPEEIAGIVQDFLKNGLSSLCAEETGLGREKK